MIKIVICILSLCSKYYLSLFFIYSVVRALNSTLVKSFYVLLAIFL